MFRLLLRSRPVPTSLLAALLAGCTTAPVPHDLLQQAQAANNDYAAWSTPQNAAATISTTPATSLNQLLAAPALDRLIEQALTANPDLQQTLLTLNIALAEKRQSRGQRLPQLEAGLQGSRSQDSSTGKPISESYSGSLNVSWEADIWGRLANLDAAADRSVSEKQLLLQSARDTLVADVCQQWLSLINAHQQIAIDEARVDNLQRNQSFIQSRYRSGLADREALDSIETSLASARQTLEADRDSWHQSQRALTALLGATRAADRQTSRELMATLPDSYPQVLPPLIELPAQTLQRRPDLQAAYNAIAAAGLQRRAAYKDMLPQLNLSAALTEVASSPRTALLTDPLWSLLGQLTAPLYQGGKLQAAADIAALQEAQAYQAYRATLLTAVNEVEAGLDLEQSLQRQQQLADQALAAAERNLTHYQQKYRSGLVDILDLLSIEQQTFDLRTQQNNLQLQRLSNRVSLALALGLGWDKTTAAAPHSVPEVTP